jgi:hypothetical protein
MRAITVSPEPSNKLDSHLPKHAQRYLGIPSNLWDGGNGVLVAKYTDTPFEEYTTLLAVAEEEAELEFADGRPCQQLLMMTCPDGAADECAKELARLAENLYSQDQALPYGFVMDATAGIFGDENMQAWYVAPPLYFDEELAVDVKADPPTLYLWLVAITGAERGFVESQGSDAFEALLEAQDPDMTDWGRESAV